MITQDGNKSGSATIFFLLIGILRGSLPRVGWQIDGLCTFTRATPTSGTTRVVYIQSFVFNLSIDVGKKICIYLSC